MRILNLQAPLRLKTHLSSKSERRMRFAFLDVVKKNPAQQYLARKKKFIKVISFLKLRTYFNNFSTLRYYLRTKRKILKKKRHLFYYTIFGFLSKNFIRHLYSNLFRFERLKFPLVVFKFRRKNTFKALKVFYKRFKTIRRLHKVFLEKLYSTNKLLYKCVHKPKLLSINKIIYRRSENNYFLTVITTKNKVLANFSGGTSGLKRYEACEYYIS